MDQDIGFRADARRKAGLRVRRRRRPGRSRAAVWVNHVFARFQRNCCFCGKCLLITVGALDNVFPGYTA